MSIWRLTALGIATLLLTFAGSISPNVVSAQQTSVCATGGAVPNPDTNPGLVSDCETLLAARGHPGGDRRIELGGGYAHGGVDWCQLPRDTRACHSVGVRTNEIDRGYTDGAGQPLKPGDAGPRGEPVDRGYTDGAGQPLKLDNAVTVGGIN